MSDTAAFVGRRIHDARKTKGWSQTELATAAKRTQATISLWESAKRTPGLDDLIDLSEALGQELGYFFPPEEVRQPIHVLLRGTVERIAGTRMRKVVDDLLDRADAEGLPTARFHFSSTQPVRAAEELLKLASVREPPVGVEALARDCGALVVHEHMPDGLSGLVFEMGDGAVIAINSRHHPNRQRFSTAHELGHHLLDHHERFHIDVQDSDVPGYDWQVERAANEFAAELLMPADMVREWMGAYNDTARLADFFQVSELAMGYRLVNLGLKR